MFIDRKVSWQLHIGITGTKSLFFSRKMDKIRNRNIRPKIRNQLIEINSLLNSQACVCEENEICVAFCFNHRVSNIGIKSILYHFHVNLGKLFLLPFYISRGFWSSRDLAAPLTFPPGSWGGLLSTIIPSACQIITWLSNGAKISVLKHPSNIHH